MDRAVRGVCTHRGWTLRAINVRTNHVHVVVSAPCDPDKVLNDFKAYATRGMRKAGVWQNPITPWAERGSRKYLWKLRSVERAVDYVLNHQGDDLIPDFDEDEGLDHSFGYPNPAYRKMIVRKDGISYLSDNHFSVAGRNDDQGQDEDDE
ncbi:MAG: transposase [Blastocatellia bacterium]